MYLVLAAFTQHNVFEIQSFYYINHESCELLSSILLCGILHNLFIMLLCEDIWVVSSVWLLLI
jgi:hypothetical protein